MTHEQSAVRRQSEQHAAGIQVVVLAGGLGARLGRRGRTVPKALQPVNGTPFLDIFLAHLVEAGVRRFHFALGHLAALVSEHVRTRWGNSLDATFSEDPTPRGTAGSLAACRAALDEVFLVTFGDAFLPEDPRRFMVALHANDGGLMAVSRHRADAPPNARVAGDHIAAYAKAGLPAAEVESDDGHLVGSDAGWLALRRAELNVVPGGSAAVDLDVIHQNLIRQGRLGAWVTDLPFYDIGTPERIVHFAASPWSRTSPRLRSSR